MFSLIFSMFTFSLSMSISPGPVNITILSSSMNYGLKQTFAFISGATIGFTALLAAVCFGLYQVISLYPILLNIITALGNALYLFLFILIYFVVCYLSLLIWGYAGQKLAVFLNQGSRMRVFNMVMGVLLMLIALQMSWSHFYA